MNLLKLLLKLVVVACVAIAALTIAGRIRQRAASAPAAGEGAVGDKLSDAGFFLLSRDDAKNPKVIIMSPPNCPSEEAARARALAGSLQQAGIPHEMRSGIGFDFTDPADVERVNRRMANIANPLVLVHGWAKGNPTAAEIIAQYRAGK